MSKLINEESPECSTANARFLRIAKLSRTAAKQIAVATMLTVPGASFATGIVFHDGFMRFDDNSYDQQHQDMRQDRYARWMQLQGSRDVRSYSVNSSAGNGTDNRFDLRHSRVELYDQDHWNPESLLHSSTQFQLVQRAGSSWLHAAGSFTDSESHYQTGISLGRMLLSASSGYGKGFSKLGGDRSDLDPWFFHGGTAEKFDYSGAAVGFSLSADTTVNAGSWRVVSDGLEVRKSQFVGIDQNYGKMNLAARVYNFTRGDDSIAQAIQFSADGRLAGIGVRDFQHANGARIQELNLRYSGFDSGTVGLSLSQRSNPLFRESEDTRVMLSFNGQLGNTGNVFRASDDSDPDNTETEVESNRVRNSVLIGLGVVAGVAVASSGDSKQDESPRFNSEAGAAQGLANSINPTCITENREYGAWVYRNQDSSFGHLPLRKGDIASVNLGPRSQAPSGSTVTASYHCHGGPDRRYINEEFSPQDIRVSRSTNTNGYLSTPGGTLQKYNVRTDTITRIGNAPTAD